MDLSLFCTDDPNKRTTASLAEDLAEPSLKMSSTFVSDTLADKSSETLTHTFVSQFCQGNGTDSDRLKTPSSSFALTDYLIGDCDVDIHASLDKSEPQLHRFTHLSHEPVLPQWDSSREPFGAASLISDGFMGCSSPAHSSESDSAEAPAADLYIFEPDTFDFTLNYDAGTNCPDFPLFSQIENHHYCDTHTPTSDSDVLTKGRRSSAEEQAVPDSESDVGQCAPRTPPVSDACEKSAVSVNDERVGKAGVRTLNTQARRSDSPIELWLDACQYLGGEEADDMDVLNRTSHPVSQREALVTGDLSFLRGETQGSGYDWTEGKEGIGWSCEDTRSWGPVQRWSSVDSWATALSDWPGISVASPDDITQTFTEIGAEIEALTQALAEVTADTDCETVESQNRTQPNMGIQDQPETSILPSPACCSLFLEAPGRELQDSQSTECLCDFTATRHGEKEGGESSVDPIHPDSSLDSFNATAEGYEGNLTTPSADLDLTQFGVCWDLETDIFTRSNDPVVLAITEDSDSDGRSATVEPAIGETFTDEWRMVRGEPGPASVHQRESQWSYRSAEADTGGTVSLADFCSPTTHSLARLHVPSEGGQPGPSFNAPAHVSHCTLPSFDGTCQVEPQWGSPEFIMPLAPLSRSSSLVWRTGSNLDRDHISAKRSLNENEGPVCDHVHPFVSWPTSYEITHRVCSERTHERQSCIESSERCECEKKTILEEINDLARELSNLASIPADHFLVSEKDRIAIITLDINDPFVPKPATVKSEKPNQRKADEMPHRGHKDGKARSKKDKSAGHHHGTQVSKKQENICHQQTSKPKETPPLTGENATVEIPSAEIKENQAKLANETANVTAEKTPNKPHGKKKKKHGQKSVEEPLVDNEGARSKTAKGRIEMFETKLSSAVEKPPKQISSTDTEKKPEKKLPLPETKPPPAEQQVHLAETKDHQPKTFTSPPKDDVIKRRRLSEDKFGKIRNILEPKLPKADVHVKAKTEEANTEGEAARKKAYGDVVKQKTPPREDPKVVQPIQATAVSGDPQSLCLWCQFSAVFSDYTVTWSRDGGVLAEIKRSAGDESRVSFNISNASHKDLGKYQCRLSSSHGSVTVEYQLTYEVLSEIVIPPSPTTVPSISLEVETEGEDVLCSRLMFKEDFLADQHFGDNHPVSIVTEKVHFGEGMHRRAFRTRLQAGQVSTLQSGHNCVLKVHTAISYGTNNNEELIQRNFSLAVEECKVQNTAREYIKAYTTAAESFEAFGEVPDIIPIYLVHRSSNDIPYATLEEELIGDFVKYSVKDGKEINLLRRDSVAGQKCCAFQHWVYHNTGGNLLVTDMQGVGMRLTDVGIATCKKGYKGFKGNCATSFIDQFKALHQCNLYCEILGLSSLQPKPKKPASAPKPKPPPPAAPKKKTFGPTLKGKS